MKILNINNHILKVDERLHTIYNEESEKLLIGYNKLGYFDLGMEIKFVNVFGDYGVDIKCLNAGFISPGHNLWKFKFEIVVRNNEIEIKLKDFKENLWHL